MRNYNVRVTSGAGKFLLLLLLLVLFAVVAFLPAIVISIIAVNTDMPTVLAVLLIIPVQGLWWYFGNFQVETR